jgi:hypothetical protein
MTDMSVAMMQLNTAATTDSILHWNQIALDAVKTDFSTSSPAIDPSPQQGGPTRTSRALAIVHLAMYDAYMGITGEGGTYLQYEPAKLPESSDINAAHAAVSSAACLTLISLYSRQTGFFLQEHQNYVAMLPGHDPVIAQGLTWGSHIAARMLAERENDGSAAPDSFYAPSPEPGRHRPDPLNPGQGFLGPLWGNVKPFGVDNLNLQVAGSPPPALNSTKYADDFNEVFHKGRNSGGNRTTDETTIGLFWAYDGPRNIGVPPRFYNQVVRAIVEKHCPTEAENARLFALINVAMADAGIQCWYEKYKYNMWRPVLGIREADAGWGPTGEGDDNPDTTGDPYWIPLGAPATNQPAKAASTPQFPSYPSGHATFGTAALRIAALALDLPDDFELSVVSDELDGKSIGATGVRARHERTFTINDAIEENIISRVYLGVHWEFDGREGEKNGEKIACLIHGSFPAKA